MVDYRNHRRFTIKCIKASITPISCKLKNPLLHKSVRSYQIIHKAEKQLLYERIRNINSILATLDKQRESQYQKFKDTLEVNNSDHEHVQYLDRSRTFIYKIKEHRHDKIKKKDIDKFKKLYFKRYGYHHNLNRHNTSFGNIDHNFQALGRQSIVPSNFSTRTTNHSSTSSAPATPMAPTPSTHTADFQPAAIQPVPRQPASNHTCTSHMDKWVINLSKNLSTGTAITTSQLNKVFSTPRNNYPFYKKVPVMPSPPNTPIEAYITSTEQAANKLPPQEADELRSDVNRILKQVQQQHNKHCNLNPPSARPLQNSNKTSPGWFLQQTKGWPWSSWTNRTTQKKHKLYYRTPTPTKFSPKTPPPYLKNKLITLLKDIKQTGGLSTQKYKQLYHTSAVPPKFYGLPKINKTGTPLRPIVSSRGSITYGVAKELSHIIKPLVGQSPHHLKNTQHFIQQLQGKKLEPGK